MTTQQNRSFFHLTPMFSLALPTVDVYLVGMMTSSQYCGRDTSTVELGQVCYGVDRFYVMLKGEDTLIVEDKDVLSSSVT